MLEASEMAALYAARITALKDNQTKNLKMSNIEYTVVPRPLYCRWTLSLLIIHGNAAAEWINRRCLTERFACQIHLRVMWP